MHQLSYNSRKCIYAFTLAEVLITLAVIGIVAAMTIPTLMNKHQERVTVTKVKKLYSVLTEAFKLTNQQYIHPEDWRQNGTWEDGPRAFMKNLKTVKLCDEESNLKECMPDGLNPGTGSVTAVLPDGSTIAVYVTSNCSGNVLRDPTSKFNNYCGYIYTDVNGFKKPNEVGKDQFWFIFTKDNLYPVGIPDGYQKGEADFVNNCMVYHQYCTGWVITNENLDYLKCNDLSFYGKKKCN